MSSKPTLNEADFFNGRIITVGQAQSNIHGLHIFRAPTKPDSFLATHRDADGVALSQENLQQTAGQKSRRTKELANAAD